MKVHFLGVRGSTPASGDQFRRVGGHTSCVAIAPDEGPCALVLDAGTGLDSVGALLGGAPFRGTILLGHLHLDHTQGLPFFAAGDRPDARVHVVLPEQGIAARELLDRCYAPPHFPITMSDLLGTWTFATIDEGAHDVEGYQVVAARVAHPGGRTLGYRISDGAATVVYISDHAPDHEPGSFDAAVALAAGADLLIHDSQFTDDEQRRFLHYGHSTPGVALRIAERAGARRLALFHHAPRRPDDAVEAMAADVRSAAVEVVLACEGLTIELPSGVATPRR